MTIPARGEQFLVVDERQIDHLRAGLRLAEPENTFSDPSSRLLKWSRHGGLPVTSSPENKPQGPVCSICQFLPPSPVSNFECEISAPRFRKGCAPSAHELAQATRHTTGQEPLFIMHCPVLGTWFSDEDMEAQKRYGTRSRLQL